MRDIRCDECDHVMRGGAELTTRRVVRELKTGRGACDACDAPYNPSAAVAQLGEFVSLCDFRAGIVHEVVAVERRIRLLISFGGYEQYHDLDAVVLSERSEVAA